MHKILFYNPSKVFKSRLINGRDNPSITCLEYIGIYLMKRLATIQKAIHKLDVQLTPTTIKFVEEFKTETRHYRTIYAWNGKYHV